MYTFWSVHLNWRLFIFLERTNVIHWNFQIKRQQATYGLIWTRSWTWTPSWTCNCEKYAATFGTIAESPLLHSSTSRTEYETIPVLKCFWKTCKCLNWVESVQMSQIASEYLQWRLREREQNKESSGGCGNFMDAAKRTLIERTN